MDAAPSADFTDRRWQILLGREVICGSFRQITIMESGYELRLAGHFFRFYTKVILFFLYYEVC